MADTKNLVVELLDKNNNKVSVKVPQVREDVSEGEILVFMKKCIDNKLFLSNEGLPITQIGGAKSVETKTVQYAIPRS